MGGGVSRAPTFLLRDIWTAPYCLSVFLSLVFLFQFISVHINSLELVLMPPEAFLVHSEAFVWMDGLDGLDVWDGYHRSSFF